MNKQEFNIITLKKAHYLLIINQNKLKKFNHKKKIFVNNNLTLL